MTHQYAGHQTKPTPKQSALQGPKRGTITAGRTSKNGVDDEEAQALRAEGLDPDDAVARSVAKRLPSSSNVIGWWTNKCGIHWQPPPTVSVNPLVAG
jgi:hypothetical protein